MVKWRAYPPETKDPNTKWGTHGISGVLLTVLTIMPPKTAGPITGWGIHELGVVGQYVLFIMPIFGLVAVIYGLWTITRYREVSTAPAPAPLTAVAMGAVMIVIPILIIRA